MANQNNRSLLDLLQEISNLPEYIQDDAVKNIVAEWSRKSPLVDEVVNGRSTFEEAITVLVEENRRLTYLNRKGDCNSPQFEVIGKETAKKFTDILPLVGYWPINQAGIVKYHLTDTVDFGKFVRSTVKFKFSLALILTLPVWGLVSYFDPNCLPYWKWAIACGIGLGLLLSVSHIFFGYSDYLSDRRALAEKTLQYAKYLDAMLKPQRA